MVAKATIITLIRSKFDGSNTICKLEIKDMKIAIVGATGLVGSVMQEVLNEKKVKADEWLLVASERSAGKKLTWNDKEYTLITNKEAVALKPDIAIFSAGGSVSLEWAPKYADVGCFVIDNSSAWRMDPTKKLVVPEINADLLTKEDKIIANPNCSTIQMVLALSGLHREYGIQRLVISTYQSYTGTGSIAVRQYDKERANQEAIGNDRAYPHPIFANCIPHCDVFLENDYTKEEMKLVNETQKILSDQSIKITATAVRVPVNGGHSEAVNVEFKKPYEVGDVKEILSNTPGVIVMDDLANNHYPTPLQAHHKDEVFVGRIRRDDSIENGLNLWIVSDNLRKGAATNAVQIAQNLIQRFF